VLFLDTYCRANMACVCSENLSKIITTLIKFLEVFKSVLYVTSNLIIGFQHWKQIRT